MVNNTGQDCIYPKIKKKQRKAKMKIDPKFKLSSCLANEPARYDFHLVQLDPGNERAVVSNGRCLAIVPIELEKGDGIADMEYPILPASIQKANEKGKVEKSISVEGKEVTISTENKYGEPTGEKTSCTIEPCRTFYPDVYSIFPSDECIQEISLNPFYLVSVAKALGLSAKDGDNAVLKLQFYSKDGSKPVAIETVPYDENLKGLIMPVTK